MNKFLIGLVFLALGVRGQEAQVLTLKDAISYALENKAEAKKAQLDVERSDYQIQEVRSRALPQITLNGNLTYNPTIQKSFINAEDFGGPPGQVQELTLGQKWSSIGGVALTQNIFDLAVFTGLRAAKTTREFYRINAQLTDEQIIESVANNYYQVYVLRQRLTVLDSNYATTSKIHRIIQGQFDNGLARRIDLDRMTVRLSNISTQRQQALNAVQLQEHSLKFFMGMPIDTPIILPKGEFEVTPQLATDKPDVMARTEYQLLKTQEKLLQFNKKAIEAEYYPSLSLSAGFNYIGQGPEFPWGGRPEDRVFWSNFSAIGLNLRVPVFNGFATRARVRQADVELRQLQADLEDTQLSLDLAFRNAQKQVENSAITIQNQRENVLLAERVLDNTQNNYSQGLASLTDLLDAENARTEAQNNYTNALLQYKLAEVQLAKSKGELKTLTN